MSRRCTVELFGIARLRADRRSVALCLDDVDSTSSAVGVTVGDALRALAVACPELVGPVLTPESSVLCDGYLLNLNGRNFVKSTEAPLADGDQLLLIASAAGGGGISRQLSVFSASLLMTDD